MERLRWCYLALLALCVLAGLFAGRVLVLPARYLPAAAPRTTCDGWQCYEPRRATDTLEDSVLRLGKDTDRSFILTTLSYNLRDLNTTLRLTVPEPLSGKANRSDSIIRFLSDYRNPCWVERLPRIPFAYEPADWTYAWQPHEQALPAEYNNDAMERYLNSAGRSTRVRCLPFLLIAGVYKGGTTDMFYSLASHHQVAAPVVKEPWFWAMLGGATRGVKFSHYLDLYDEVAETIRKDAAAGGFHPKITLDASTGTFLGYAMTWRHQPWNSGAGAPRVTLARHLAAFSPRTRALLMLREPAAWMESCYNHFRALYSPTSSAALHQHVIVGVREFGECMRVTSGNIRFCFSLRAERHPCRVETTLYHVFVKEWRETLGVDRVMVVNSERYFRNRTDVLRQVARFLGLEPFATETVSDLASLPPANQKLTGDDVIMLNVTREVIREFVRPWNVRLADYLNDSSFLWS